MRKGLSTFLLYTMCLKQSLYLWRKNIKDSMWERMFDLVLGLKKEHRLMIVITLIYAVTLFGITVDVEAMENWLQLVGYTIRTLCIACIIQLSVFFLTNIFWKELNRGFLE